MWIESLIGTGGTAQVFRVRNQADGNLLAAKVLSDHRFEVDDGMRARFEREGRVLAQVDSPNVIRLVGMDEWDGEPIMLLELAEGGSVSGILHDLGVPPPSAIVVRWLRDALSGAAALHSLGIVHRDISPKNLLVRADGAVAVADFGTVRHVDDETLTQDGVRLGSLIYISRQQFEKPRHAAPNDDVYSLGQIAWRLFAGRHPIGNAPSLADVRPDLSPEIVALAERMRDDDPTKRPVDASVALEELDAIADPLVKPTLRRNPMLRTKAGELVHNPLSASVLAIGARQMDELERIGRRRGSTSVVWALGFLVDVLGPLRFEEASASDPPHGPQEKDGLPPTWFSSGSVRIDRVAAASRDLLTLTNAVTGLTLSYSLGEPHVVQDAPWHAVLHELEALNEWSADERSALFRIFAAEQFVFGMPCGVCWKTTGLGVGLLLDPDHDGRLFRAGICSHNGPTDDPMCCVCGIPLRRAPSRDEYGPYAAVGCACPALAFDVEFDDRPWEKGRPLTPERAPTLFEQT